MAYKNKSKNFLKIQPAATKALFKAGGVSGQLQPFGALVPVISTIHDTELISYPSLPQYGQTQPLLAYNFGTNNQQLNLASTGEGYSAYLDKKFIVYVQYDKISNIPNISGFYDIVEDYRYQFIYIQPPWEKAENLNSVSDFADYIYVKSFIVLDNTNDGEISSTNPRATLANTIPVVPVTIDSVRLQTWQNYDDNSAYNNIFKGKTMAYSFTNFYMSQGTENIPLKYPCIVSHQDFRALPVWTVNASGAFLGTYTIFRNVDELSLSLKNWGFPYTFDYDSAFNKNVSDFPDYVPDGQPDNPTGGGDGDGDNSSDSISFPAPIDVFSPSALGGYNTLFMSPAEFEQFVKILWTPVIKSLGDVLSVYFNQQPLTESVINMYYVPFDLKTQLDFSGTKTEQRADLTLAWSDTPFAARLLVSNVSRELMGGGELDLNEYYGSFLDYSPYTSVDIWLPYIGYKSLDVDKVMGKKISLKWFVDIVNGGLTCVIFANGQPINTYTGQIGIDLAITGRDYATKMRRVVDNIGGLVGSVNKGVSAAANGIGSMVAGGAGAGAAGAEVSAAGGASAAGSILSSVGGSVVGGAGNVAQALMQQQTTTHYGTVDGENWLLMPQVAHLKITRTISATPADYIELRGYPASYTGTVGGFSGFLLADSLNMSAPAGATDDEIAAIRSAILNEGVII